MTTRAAPTRRPARSWSRWSARLEAGGTTLEESLALWERGEELAKVCQEWLDGARKRLDEAMDDRRTQSAGQPRLSEPD